MRPGMLAHQVSTFGDELKTETRRRAFGSPKAKAVPIPLLRPSVADLPEGLDWEVMPSQS